MPNRKVEVNTGDKYNNLTLIKEVECIGKGRNFLCKCDCGNEKVIKLNDLRQGRSKSCGCLARDNWRFRKPHHQMAGTRIYDIWRSMKSRCFYKNDVSYDRYGGRGITVCDEWLTFEKFHEWARSNGYSDNLSIDRIDNDGNYEPGNCRWATTEQQAGNRSTTVRVSRNGVTKSLMDWCELENINRAMVYQRLRRGWSVEEAFNVPPVPSGCKRAN